MFTLDKPEIDIPKSEQLSEKKLELEKRLEGLDSQLPPTRKPVKKGNAMREYLSLAFFP